MGLLIFIQCDLEQVAILHLQLGLSFSSSPPSRPALDSMRLQCFSLVRLAADKAESSIGEEKEGQWEAADWEAIEWFPEDKGEALKMLLHLEMK